MKKVYIGLSVLFVIVLLIQFPHMMVNPGELVEGHQKLNNKCFSCHKPFGGIANEKCISCHKLADIGINSIAKPSKTLFHEQLSGIACSSCHIDHQGVFPEHPINAFDHELLSKAIINNCNTCHIKPTDNLHAQVTKDCNSCHQSQNWKTLIAFNHEVLLNKNNCTSCHQKPIDDYHSIIKENCDQCHSTRKWIPSTFDHTNYFILDQNHNAACNICHTNNNFKSYTCYGCHEHNEKSIIAEHNEEGISNIGNCIACHKSGNEHEIRTNGKMENGKEQDKRNDNIQSKGRKEGDDD